MLLFAPAYRAVHLIWLSLTLFFVRNRELRHAETIRSIDGGASTMLKRALSLLAVLLASLASRAQTAARTPVMNGIDVLEQDHFSALKQLAAKHEGHLRLALMTNQTGVDSTGRRTADVLFTDAPRLVPGLTVVNLFSPEHGINGILDQHDIKNDHDPATGLDVISLFGATDAQRRPSKEQLANLDAVIIDLQDVGVHFYTYETVVGYFLEAAAGTKIDIIILDRPNPIGGTAVQGMVSSPGRESYINYTSEPVRHGMTMGELATYFKAKNRLDTQLLVIRMRGWRRTDWFDSTGQLWINPSPNLRNLAQAILYPGVGLLERTNLSVGRGTRDSIRMDRRAVAGCTKNCRLPQWSPYPWCAIYSRAVHAG